MCLISLVSIKNSTATYNIYSKLFLWHLLLSKKNKVSKTKTLCGSVIIIKPPFFFEKYKKWFKKIQKRHFILL